MHPPDADNNSLGSLFKSRGILSRYKLCETENRCNQCSWMFQERCHVMSPELLYILRTRQGEGCHQNTTLADSALDRCNVWYFALICSSVSSSAMPLRKTREIYNTPFRFADFARGWSSSVSCLLRSQKEPTTPDLVIPLWTVADKLYKTREKAFLMAA